MEVGQLATVESHESGAEFQLVNTATGKPEDVIFLVKGLDSKAWRQAQKEQRRKHEGEEDIDLFDHEYLWPMIASIIIDWQELQKDGKPFEYSKENALWLCENSPNVVNQIFAFLLDRKNFING